MVVRCTFLHSSLAQFLSSPLPMFEKASTLLGCAHDEQKTIDATCMEVVLSHSPLLHADTDTDFKPRQNIM